MVNAVLTTEYITARELAELKDISIRAVQKACQNGKYQFRLVPCNGGQQYEILIGSVEPEFQEKIYQPAISEQGGVTALLPVPFSLKEGVDCFAPLAMTGQGASVAVVPNALPLASGVVQAPQKAKRIGLARYDLVKIWENFRENFGKVEEESFVPNMAQLDNLWHNSENRHRLKLLTKDIKLTVKEIVLLTNIPKKTIFNRITSGKYKFETEPSRGAKGEKYLVYLSNFDEDKQVEWFLANQNDYPEIVEMMKNSYSLKKSGTKKIKKTEADNEFIALYNNSLAYPTLFEILGNVSINTLYRWKKLSENGYTALIPEYNYRINASRKTKLSDIERKFFLDILLRPQKSSIGTAFRLVKYVLEIQGITDICSEATYRRFGDWFKSRNLDTWVLMREGQKALVDKVAPYVKRDPSLLEVGDVLVADGHTLDFQVVNPFTGKPCRATLVGYMDWKSNALVGYEIMLTENTQCIAAALRNAIIRLGKIPKVSYQDNGKAFRSKFFEGTKNLDELGFTGVFGSLGIIPVFARPYNAKAKTIERFWREFTQKFESLMSSYVGNNIQNKPAYMLRNEKFHKDNHKKWVPTIEQATVLIEEWLDYHYSQPCPHVEGKTIGQVFNEGAGDGVDIDLLDELLMATETREIGRNGVKFLNNHYDADELYGIKDKVTIKYSLFDLSKIKVYGSDGQFICQAEAVMAVHPMANVLGTANDIYNYKQALKRTKSGLKITRRKAKKGIDANSLMAWQQTAIEMQKTKTTAIETEKEIETEKAEKMEMSKWLGKKEAIW